MSRVNPEELAWTARVVLRRIGWTMPAVLAAALVTVAGYAWWIAPVEREVADVMRDTEALRGKLTQRVPTPQSADPAAQIQEFYRRFPAPGSVPETLAAIFAAASAANLGIDHAEYHMAAIPAGELSRYDIVLPLKGRYSQIRQFLAQVLTEHPNVALDGVSFSRQTAAEIGIDAQVRLALYLRGRE